VTADAAVNLWDTAQHAEAYLERADTLPHRAEADAALLEHVPASVARVLDLGTGNGRLVAMLKRRRPDLVAVAVDFSPTMLELASARFAGDPTVTVVPHDLQDAIDPAWGRFDAVVSSFAIHHVDDDRKRALYGEVLDVLEPGGVFCNLEHVSSPTPALHLAFLDAINVAHEDDDPSNKLCAVETQLGWMRQLGYDDVDCHWKWREMALLAGRRPA
jgi:tRNA (cmo5U34)-methyltransferase